MNKWRQAANKEVVLQGIGQRASVNDGISETLSSGEEISFRNVTGSVIWGTLLFQRSGAPCEHMSVLISVEPDSSNVNKIAFRKYGGANNQRGQLASTCVIENSLGELKGTSRKERSQQEAVMQEME